MPQYYHSYHSDNTLDSNERRFREAGEQFIRLKSQYTYKNYIQEYPSSPDVWRGYCKSYLDEVLCNNAGKVYSAYQKAYNSSPSIFQYYNNALKIADEQTRGIIEAEFFN
ncbi:hypothetical protein K040078D81_24660 [Blautia hominis]|uniref:Uncharacterized protein n=1 Tax=Blautia hominis TaxID=2025493 RepID=A0ABQ0BA74_9FIRM